MKLKLGIILLCLCHSFLFAQHKAKIDSLKKLGRDSLIKLAIKQLNEEGFDPSAYDRIKVKVTKEGLVVDFGLSVSIADGKDCYYSSVYVALAGSGSGKSIQGFCDEPKFYKLTNARKKKIDFVFKSINKSDEIGHLKDNKVSPGNTMEITEKLTYYYVEVDSWSTHSSYKVDKITGNISDASHKHYARSHDERPDEEIIK